MIHTVGGRGDREALLARMRALRPEDERRFGTLTPHEMLCHLGDATDMVLKIRPRPAPLPPRSRPVIKLVALWSPMRWPDGHPTSPTLDPRREGTKPDRFDEDRARAIRGIEGIAVATEGALESVHGVFGSMSVRDWQRWAWKHTDHHLRQFGR